MTRRNKKKLLNKRGKSTKDGKEPVVMENGSAGENEVEDVFDVNDLLSRLPSLCIIHIFKHLTRSDLVNMTTVSKAMACMTREPSLAKWDGHLHIRQTRDGYGFDFEVEIQKVPSRWINLDNLDDYMRSYQYEIMKNAHGEFIETRSAYPGEANFLSTWEQSRAHLWPVPDQLIAALTGLLPHCNAFVLTISCLPLDPNFFSHLLTAMKGQSIADLAISVIDGEPITYDGRMSLACFIKELGVEMIYVFSPSTIMNEDFIRVLAGSRVWKLVGEYNGRQVMGPPEQLSQYFTPTESILSHIVRYKILRVPTMILKKEWLMRLIMMYIAANSSITRSRWQFTIDEPIAEDEISRQVPHGYEYLWDDHLEEHLIIRSCDRLELARIGSYSYEKEGRTIEAVEITICKNGC